VCVKKEEGMVITIAKPTKKSNIYNQTAYKFNMTDLKTRIFYCLVFLIPISTFGQSENTQLEQQKELVYAFMDSVLKTKYQDKYVIDSHTLRERNGEESHSFWIHDRYQPPVWIIYYINYTPELLFDQKDFEKKIASQRAQVERRIGQSTIIETALLPLFQNALVLSSTEESFKGIGTQVFDIFTKEPLDLKVNFYDQLHAICYPLCDAYQPDKVVFQIYFQKPEIKTPVTLDRFTLFSTDNLKPLYKEFITLEYSLYNGDYQLQKEQFLVNLSKQEMNALKSAVENWKSKNSRDNWTTHIDYVLYESLDNTFRLKKFRLVNPVTKEYKNGTIDLKTLEINVLKR
jgi:hypothetical protein